MDEAEHAPKEPRRRLQALEVCAIMDGDTLIGLCAKDTRRPPTTMLDILEQLRQLMAHDATKRDTATS